MANFDLARTILCQFRIGLVQFRIGLPKVKSLLIVKINNLDFAQPNLEIFI